MSRKECCEKFIAPHRNALTAHAAAYFFCIKDKSPSEIAEIMDLPESQVRAMIQKRLKNALNAKYGLSRMSDSIDRQAAIEAFDCCDLTPDGGIDANDAIDILKQLPPAQPEIVRCKDCVHSDTFPEGADNDMPLKCLDIRYGGVNADWYCEHAKKRR